MNTFPSNFTWGAAAASYQIEGAHDADGKGPSVWDMMCRVPGRILNGDTGDIACDHYHRTSEDVALMQAMGLRAYRFSISWPRVIPSGTGVINAAGLGFYDRLVDDLLAADIEPWVTLFHWDYPLDLYQRGGWLNPDSPQWFADYTAAVVDRLSDRVRHWMTLNEPQCFIGFGHFAGYHAPGLKLGRADVLQAAHHTLLAHGRAVQTIRAHSRHPLGPRIGWVPVGLITLPATDVAADIEAARTAMFTVNPAEANPVWNNAWWNDAALLGHYPEDGIKLFADDLPKIKSDDWAIIHQPMDFLGLNIYAGESVSAPANPSETSPVPVKGRIGRPASLLHWPVTPDSLYWGPRLFAERYRLPIVIAENGLSCHDWVALDGAVHDPQRIDYTQRYLRALRRACDDGVPVEAYFHWSLMDNFEWAEGYRQRFGLIHVDYVTQKRTIKDSATWYRSVIETNGAVL